MIHILPLFAYIKINILIYYVLCAALILSIVSKSLQPHGQQTTKLLCPWGFSRQNTEVGYHALLQEIFLTQGSSPGILHCKLWINIGTFTADPLGKLNNTSLSSLSLLQGIFPMQELNHGLLYCRKILYQLSYQGSPLIYYINMQILYVLHNVYYMGFHGSSGNN